MYTTDRAVLAAMKWRSVFSESEEQVGNQQARPVENRILGMGKEEQKCLKTLGVHLFDMQTPFQTYRNQEELTRRGVDEIRKNATDMNSAKFLVNSLAENIKFAFTRSSKSIFNSVKPTLANYNENLEGLKMKISGFQSGIKALEIPAKERNGLLTILKDVYDKYLPQIDEPKAGESLRLAKDCFPANFFPAEDTFPGFADAVADPQESNFSAGDIDLLHNYAAQYATQNMKYDNSEEFC